MDVLICCIVLLLTTPSISRGGEEAEEGVKFANKCEVCKILAVELETKLEETGRSQDVIEVGYSLDDSGKQRKKTKYKKSELRLVESLDGICEQVLQYNIHKERGDSTRFAKGMSQTFKTLHGLVNKGVKVELGIPVELWDKPSVEITQMKTQCESLLEEYESDIEDWFFNHQGDVPLKTYLCSSIVLRYEDDSCLWESESSQVQGNNAEMIAHQKKSRDDSFSKKEEL